MPTCTPPNQAPCQRASRGSDEFLVCSLDRVAPYQLVEEPLARSASTNVQRSALRAQRGQLGDVSCLPVVPFRSAGTLGAAGLRAFVSDCRGVPVYFPILPVGLRIHSDGEVSLPLDSCAPSSPSAHQSPSLFGTRQPHPLDVSPPFPCHVTRAARHHVWWFSWDGWHAWWHARHGWYAGNAPRPGGGHY